MPGMSGREFAKCVAQLPNPIPVILMSGYSDTSPILDGLVEGRVDSLRFIAKPFKAHDLIRKISDAFADSA